MDYTESIVFLKEFRPNGPWVLTAIEIDNINPEVVTTTLFNDKEVEEWLKIHEPEKNIYFTVNNVMSPVNKKPGKINIGSAEWLHVDVDPVNPPEEYDEEERKKFLKAEQERLKTLIFSNEKLPKPTLVIYSGGGYQAFWKLSHPFQIDGLEERWSEFEFYTKYIQEIFKGDHCFNVDRIMRLPGTINKPDKKKRAKGREPVKATVVDFQSYLQYPIEQFPKYQKLQSRETAGFNNRLVEISGNIKRFDSIEAISEKIRPNVGVVIAQGNDPDNPSRFPSRSEWLFYAICEMIRADCDNDTIFSVITDPEWGISESVLERGRNAEKYAIRQIERGREMAIHPLLSEMNDKFAVIKNYGGRCLVVSQQYRYDLNRYEFSSQDFTNFKHAHCNRKVQIGEKKKTAEPIYQELGQWWLTHPKRREYETITFVPGSETPGSYNLWQGWAYEARKGKCELLLGHIMENVCGNEMRYYKYLIGWMARCVQKPQESGQVVVVFRGKKGVGKSFLAKAFGKLAGQHFMEIADSKHLVGNFNYHLKDCLILYADEAFFAGDKSHESVLKNLITSNTMTSEKKYSDATQTANYLHIMMSSNEDWVVPASGEERRYFVLDVKSNRIQDRIYFASIEQELENGGYEAFLNYLMNYDLSTFDVRDVPKTDALQEQKQLTMGVREDWWYHKLHEGYIFSDRPKFEDDYLLEELRHDFLTHMRSYGSRKTYYNSRTFDNFLQKCLPNYEKSKYQGNEPDYYKLDGETKTIARPYYLSIPSLDVCRKHFDKEFGGPFPWPKVNQKLKLDMGQESW